MIGGFRRWYDQHERRAARRRRTEEIIAWICVPLIVVMGLYVWRIWDDYIAARDPLRQPAAVPAGVTPLPPAGGSPPLRP